MTIIARFEGSDRQGRGRLVAALRAGPVAWSEVPSAAGWAAQPERARRMAQTLLAEGMAVADGDRLQLP